MGLDCARGLLASGLKSHCDFMWGAYKLSPLHRWESRGLERSGIRSHSWQVAKQNLMLPPRHIPQWLSLHECSWSAWCSPAIHVISYPPEPHNAGGFVLFYGEEKSISTTSCAPCLRRCLVGGRTQIQNSRTVALVTQDPP